MIPAAKISSARNSQGKTLAFLFAAFPILDIYATPLPGISIGEFLLIVAFTLLSITKPERTYRIPSDFSPIFLYAAYGISVTLFVILTQSWAIPSVMLYDAGSKILFFIIFLLGINYIKWEPFSKYLLKIANFAAGFLLLQVILSTIGVHISGIVPWLPLSNETDVADFISKQLDSDRSSSLFAEPAHFCEYMVLPLVIALIGNNQSKRKAILYASSILLSRSANGFAILGICILGFMLWRMLSIRKPLTKTIYVIFISLAGIVIVPFLAIVFEDLIERFAEISGDSASTGVHGLSGYIRVLRGYFLYGSFSTIGQIFGMGFGCILGYISSHTTPYLELTDLMPEYVNSVQYILISSGIIGLILIVKQLYRLFKSSQYQFKLALVCLAALMCSASIFFTTTTILILISAYENKSGNINNNTLS